MLFPRVGFIVTNMTGWPKKAVKFYNGRITAEQWIKEGGTVGAVRKRGGRPSLGVDAVGFKGSTATKAAFQLNLPSAMAVEGPVPVEWQRWRRQRGNVG